MNFGLVWTYMYIPSYWQVSYGDPLILSYVPNHIRLHTNLQDFRSTKLAVVNSIDNKDIGRQAMPLIKQCHASHLNDRLIYGIQLLDVTFRCHQPRRIYLGHYVMMQRGWR